MATSKWGEGRYPLQREAAARRLSKRLQGEQRTEGDLPIQGGGMRLGVNP